MLYQSNSESRTSIGRNHVIKIEIADIAVAASAADMTRILRQFLFSTITIIIV
jgi:hypothetical protein